MRVSHEITGVKDCAKVKYVFKQISSKLWVRYIQFYSTRNQSITLVQNKKCHQIYKSWQMKAKQFRKKLLSVLFFDHNNVIPPSHLL